MHSLKSESQPFGYTPNLGHIVHYRTTPRKQPNGGDDVAQNRMHTSNGSKDTVIKSRCFALTSIDLLGAISSLPCLFTLIELTRW